MYHILFYKVYDMWYVICTTLIGRKTFSWLSLLLQRLLACTASSLAQFHHLESVYMVLCLLGLMGVAIMRLKGNMLFRTYTKFVHGIRSHRIYILFWGHIKLKIRRIVVWSHKILGCYRKTRFLLSRSLYVLSSIKSNVQCKDIKSW